MLFLRNELITSKYIFLKLLCKLLKTNIYYFCHKEKNINVILNLFFSLGYLIIQHR